MLPLNASFMISEGPHMQVRRVAEENGVNVSEQIKELENRAMQVLHNTEDILTSKPKQAWLGDHASMFVCICRI